MDIGIYNRKNKNILLLQTFKEQLPKSKQGNVLINESIRTEISCSYK